jgi:hypothetical protein
LAKGLRQFVGNGTDDLFLGVGSALFTEQAFRSGNDLCPALLGTSVLLGINGSSPGIRLIASDICRRSRRFND